MSFSFHGVLVENTYINILVARFKYNNVSNLQLLEFAMITITFVK